MIKLPFLSSVVPPHVFCLLDEGVTYARVRADAPAGFEEVRHFRYPSALHTGPAGAPHLTREALSEAVKAARALSGGRLSRASVVYPDSWGRILPLELETLPADDAAGREMVLWKLRKLVPTLTAELDVVWQRMPMLTDEKRVLVATAGREAISAMERAFDELGVRVGYLAPASLALFEGLAGTLSDAASGDYVLLHRSAGTLAFFIARGAEPIFFRQRPPEGEEDHEREARLSLSYYAEKLRGSGIKAVYVHDELEGRELEKVGAFPVSVVPISGSLFEAGPDFDARLQSRPELLAGFAAVYGGA